MVCGHCGRGDGLAAARRGDVSGGCGWRRLQGKYFPEKYDSCCGLFVWRRVRVLVVIRFSLELVLLTAPLDAGGAMSLFGE